MGIVYAAVILVAVIAGAWWLGSRLPVNHSASRGIEIAVPPERLWRAIVQPSAKRRWGGASETVEAQPPRRLVTRIVGESSFGGRWTFDIEPVRDGSRITITEDGEIYNPFFRFVARYLVGHARTIETYLKQLRQEVL